VDATKDVVHLVAMTLEAAIASAVLRKLLKKLDPNLPALPPLHVVTVGIYTYASAFITFQYVKYIHSHLDAVYVLWGVLLTAILYMPLLAEAVTLIRNKTTRSVHRV
jgi:uncharacterized membrane protein YvlD (DUF360 family)